MPIYENRENAENRVSLNQEKLNRIINGTNVFSEITAGALAKFSGKGGVICLDGWYGVDYAGIVQKIENILKEKSPVEVKAVPAADFFKSLDLILEQKHPWITDEPAFGRVNEGEILSDYTDSAALAQVVNTVNADIESGKVVIVYGEKLDEYSRFINEDQMIIQVIPRAHLALIKTYNVPQIAPPYPSAVLPKEFPSSSLPSPPRSSLRLSPSLPSPGWAAVWPAGAPSPSSTP